MTTVAKGTFPGRPKKKIQKRRVKYHSKFYKSDLSDLKLTCSYITNVAQQFHLIFDEDNEQDIEFIGFSSEECGLRAYKRVRKKNVVSSPSSNDILCSQTHYDKDKVTTRRSHARDSTTPASPDRKKYDSPAGSVHSDSSVSPKKSSFSFSKDTGTDVSSGPSDSAFLKYNDFKLDFHRLSKKARNRDEGYSAEEQAKRKDTSVASLKYASEIYLAKNHALQSVTKSPIKPATFIPPKNHKQMHVLPTGETSLKIKKGARSKEDVHDMKKGAGHPQVLAKALLARANRNRKPNDSATTAMQVTKEKQKSSRGFVLPTKSTRSARIIKANRKYIDEDQLSAKEDSQRPETSETTSSPIVQSKCSVSISRIPNVELTDNSAQQDDAQQDEQDGHAKKRHHRRPLIKEPTFCIDDENSPKAKVSRSYRKSKDGGGSDVVHARARRLIKRARFKHPTSSDALVLGKDYIGQTNQQNQRNLIRQATFTAPTIKKRSRAPKHSNRTSPVRAIKSTPDFGLSVSEWNKLTEPKPAKWVVGSIEKVIPPWSSQEIHNILHGANTFGPAWSSIARQYEFQELHRDWQSVGNKGKKCRFVELLTNNYKVKSSILLQLKPKLSDNPNVTVFTANELSVRGLAGNVPCEFGDRVRCPIKTAQEWRKESTLATSADSESATSVATSRIFGTQLNVQKGKIISKNEVVKYKDINEDDLHLGLGEKSFDSMIRMRSVSQNKEPWTPWEIHNLLHGVHYFGIGSWTKIATMYIFLKSHDNIGIRGRFKSVCYRDLIVAGDVRADVLPKLHVVLSQQGKMHFFDNKIPVKMCILPKSEHSSSSSGVLKSKENHATSKYSYNHKRLGQRVRVKNPTLDNEDDEEDEDDDDMTISPPRKQAYHLFGAVPVWDEATQPDIIDINSDNANSTPVLQALEDGLRRNATSPDTKMSSTLSCSDLHMTSTALQFLPSDILSPKSTIVGENVTVGFTKNTMKSSNKANQAGKEKVSPAAKNKGKGPRIKHVCRRASLVTGQLKATREDHTPHLSALPKDEREKIAAEAEKHKVNVPEFSSSESDGEKGHHKSTNHTTARREKQPRKRNVHNRCGTCETCMQPPCDKCDACRECIDTNEVPTIKSPDCVQRKPCVQPLSNDVVVPAKKLKKVLLELQPASRKSSRLQQQRIPLKSSRAADSMASSSVGMDSSVTVDHTTNTTQHFSSPTDRSTMMSPETRSSIFANVNLIKNALIKIDYWKETYDLDLLWMNGGHALITSNPAPPRTVCLLCGSFGLPGRDSWGTDADRSSLVYCACCCEPFHSYCADDRYDQPNVISAMKNGTWVCRRCQYCRVCGHPKDLLECRRCRKTYHSECLGPNYPTKPSDSDNSVWVCMQCVRCKSCGTSKPGSLPGSQWTHDYTMCQRCGGLYDKGNYCPICQKCYSDEDYECRMIQCAGCKRWIHSKCENLSVEMYTLLSHMPENVQYKCPDCDGRSGKLSEALDEEPQENNNENTNNPPDAEKIRNILSRLPAPPWRKMIENEIQSGLEAITMALFHNRATYCVLKKNETTVELDSSGNTLPEEDANTTRPHDLFTVRFAVHNHRYQSVGAFFSDVRNILSSVPDSSDRVAVEKAFKEEAGSIFSWFNFETGKVRDSDDLPDDLLPNATMPPMPEHDYAQWLDKDIMMTPGTPNPSPMKSICGSTPSHVGSWYSPFKGTEDLRQCLFCNKYGDDKETECGRLLYCGQDEWCHVNCALWSAEVYEQHDGSLENVHSAASRGKMMKCEHCRVPGATVGCNTRDCPKNYHFMCARAANCVFQDDKRVFCARHHNHANRDLVMEEDFEVARLVCIDNDEMRPNRRWQRGMLASSVTVTVGSLTVHQLGRLGVASDSRECLMPVSYRITRVFWSTFFASRKTIYTITISERKPSVVGNEADEWPDNTNLTISHNHEENLEEIVKQPTPETAPYMSPPRPCRTNLIERMGETPEIGPLSPNRRTKLPLERNDGGTYTIMSGINKTLPQAVTPHPSPPCMSSVHDKNTQSSSSKNTEVSISSDNPLLNKPVLREDRSNDADRTQTKSETMPSQFTDVKPVLSDAALSKLNVSSTSTIRKTDEPMKSDQSLPATQSATLSSGEPITDISPPHIVSALAPSMEISKEVIHSKPDHIFEMGMSGSVMYAVDKTTLPIASEETSTDVPDVTSRVDKSALSQESDFVSIIKKEEVEDSTLLKKESETKEDVVDSFSENLILNNPKVTVKSLVNVSGEFVGEQSMPVVSLIKEARHAADVEKQTPQKVADVPIPSLWWKKSVVTRKPSKKKKGGRLTKSDEDVSPLAKFRRGNRSLDDDPNYELPSSEAPYWMKKKGEDASEASMRIQKRVLDHRSCRDAKNPQIVDDVSDVNEPDEQSSAHLQSSNREHFGEGISKATKTFIPAVSDAIGTEIDQVSHIIQDGDSEKQRKKDVRDDVTEQATEVVKQQEEMMETPGEDDAGSSVYSSVDSLMGTSKIPTSSSKLVSSEGLVTSQSHCITASTEDTNFKPDVMTNSISSSAIDQSNSSVGSDDEAGEAPFSPRKHLRKFAHKSLAEFGDGKKVKHKLDNDSKSTTPSTRLTRQRSRSQGLVSTSEKLTKKVISTSSDDASVDKLFKSPRSTLLTRSRSRHSSANSAISPTVVIEKSDIISIGADEATMSDVSAAPSDEIVARRYPRRNTYTCLKSFSGLSPNYALASYSSEDKARERATRNKPNNKKSSKPKSSNSEHTPLKSKRQTSSTSRSIEATDKADCSIPYHEDVGKNSSSSSKSISDSATTSDENVDDDEAKISAPQAISGEQLEDAVSLNKNVDDSSKTGVEYLDDAISGEVTSLEKEQLLEDIPTSSHPKEYVTGSSDVDICASTVVCDIVSTQKNIPALDDDVATFINSHDIAKSLIEDVLDCLDTQGLGKERRDSLSDIDLPVSPEKIKSDLLLMEDSIEIMRGGGEERSLMPGLDQSVTSTNPGSPMGKAEDFASLLPDEASLLLPHEVNQPTTAGIESQQIAKPISPITVPDSNMNQQLVVGGDSAFFETSECPVLNADEVKTLLETPEPTPAPIMYPVSAVLPSPINQPMIANQLQMTSPQQPHQVFVNAEQTMFHETPNLLPANAQYATLPRTLHPPVVQQTALYPNQPVVVTKQVRKYVVPQHNMVRVTQPVTFISPLVQIPVIPTPVYQTPVQHYPQVIPATHIVSPTVGSVPYSMRVTMAMTGAINTETIASQSFGTSQIHGNRRSVSQSPRCPKHRPGTIGHQQRPNTVTKQVQRHLVVKKTQQPAIFTKTQNRSNLQNISQVQQANLMSHTTANKFVIQHAAPLVVSSHLPMEMTLPSQSANQIGYMQQLSNHIPLQQQLRNQQPSSINPLLTNQIPVQTPSTNDTVPLTQPTNQVSSLDHLIEFYSAKNNLTKEEKGIVRSIISSQIQANQLPMPTNSSTSGGQINQKLPTSSSNSASSKKRRLPSQESLEKGISAKQKRKRKEKTNVLKQEFDEPWSVIDDESPDLPSHLVNIYMKRRSHLKKNQKTSAKVLSPFNIFLGDKNITNKENRLPPPPNTSPNSNKRPYLVYEIKSDDGYFAKGTDLQDLISQLLTSVQECRSNMKGCNPTVALHSVMTPHAFLGASHDAVRFLVEQLPGARHCLRYRAKYHKHKKTKEEITHINPHGCCRAEQFKGRSKPDMFSFLASKHRNPPEYQPEKHQDDDMIQLSNRRATSMEDLPMAMRFRHLRTFSKEAVGVYRSSIHGRGLFCKRDLEAGEMIMEYTGQMIRKGLTDKREKHYESKSIGCYMFRMDDLYVVDATLLGSAARFINHSCEPSCYSRIVHVEGKKHIVIFALRKIYRGEELTYDYKFPIEDEMHKIECNCGARTCRKFMN